ncbi:alpha/beta fold hydrolase [Blattabacterium sp. (Blaberus giganteus)]|uniref:alpha/beta fold hydrolase n=1 Tax=Blattabacterium sp. (Blaberus giganteus) TaxID=1186051 RepID=UPI00025F708F|nr:alpha/beta fold hydrolase [Blattabacterium sp. (Blaberus giganteus)]AFJ91031.1 alpha/beta fold family hydrolase [Blattabacterium sp. (Blaberus giganteus)]
MILYSKIYGSGYPILVLHGLFGNGENWTSFAKEFYKFYQIHLLDIRNHGNSFFSEKMNYDIISKDILEYISYYELDHPILLGHSMGGRAVMKFSIKYPMIPKKLIIVDISPKANNITNRNQKKLIHFLKKIDFNIINTRKDLDGFLKTWISDIKIRSFFSKCTKRQKNGKLCFSFSLSNIEKNYDSLIYQDIKNGLYHGPTLFLRGEYSNYILYKDYNYIEKLFPKSKICTVKKSDHWIHVDNPTEFYKKISVFLNKT